jgi:hypothetical protein
MIKLVTYTLLFNTILSAVEVTQSQQNSILMEAALFIGIFGTMGLVSYIYSSRHAKAYKKPEVVAIVSEEMSKEDRIFELLGMLNNGILTQEEYKLLHNYYRQN